MEGDSNQRRLAAILAADVAGYTKLVERDTDGTVAAWKSARDDVIKPLVDEKSGRVIKFTGDGFLVEFPSVQDAVACAIDLQDRLATSPLDFRMGVNVGDITYDGGDIHGEGVNIAARLEALAEPGGICVSGDVYNQVRNRIETKFTDMGDQEVKHVSRPVRVFAIGAIERGALESPEDALSEKPSIAVLPFDNMSADPDQEYFSDGITEDIITELSRFRSLFVIARNSSFAFKGQAVDVTEIGRKLGVQYVVEGSVRKAGGRIRITAQLVETNTGNHLWAERYDRNLADIFEVQDEVVSQIVTMVPGHVDIANRIQAERKRAQDMNAYDLLLRADHEMYQDFGSHEGERLLKRALEIDPSYAPAHARLAFFYAYSIFVHGKDVRDTVVAARVHAESALKLDPADPMIQAVVADAYLLVGEHALAGYHIDKAISLNPNEYEVMVLASEIKAYLGDYDVAVEWASKAKLSDPYSADSYRETFFDAHYLGGEYQLALEQLVGWQDYRPYIHLEEAAAFAQLDRTEEAREAVKQFENNRPEGWNMGEVIRAHARMCAKQEDAERWLEGFRKAGVDF